MSPAYTAGMRALLLVMALSSLWQLSSAGSLHSSCPAEEPSATAPADPHRDDTYGSGLLFRIEKQGTPPSHIFGTIHLDTPRLSRLPPQVNLALLQSSRLVMETDLDEQAQAVFTRRMTLPDGETLERWLSGDLLARYDKLAAYYELPADMAHRLKPWAVTSVIGRPKPTSGRTMEDTLRASAVQMGRPVHALESMDELIDALEEQTVDGQIAVLVDTICQHRRILEDVALLIALYGDGDLAGIAAQHESGHEDDAVFRSMNERILYQRSEQMAARLREHLEAGNAFIAVGALHLTGTRGVLNLLQQQGYTITRVF